MKKWRVVIRETTVVEGELMVTGGTKWEALARADALIISGGYKRLPTIGVETTATPAKISREDE